jgi:hypothetical protein
MENGCHGRAAAWRPRDRWPRDSLPRLGKDRRSRGGHDQRRSKPPPVLAQKGRSTCPRHRPIDLLHRRVKGMRLNAGPRNAGVARREQETPVTLAALARCTRRGPRRRRMATAENGQSPPRPHRRRGPRGIGRRRTWGQRPLQTSGGGPRGLTPRRLELDPKLHRARWPPWPFALVGAGKGHRRQAAEAQEVLGKADEQAGRGLRRPGRRHPPRRNQGQGGRRAIGQAQQGPVPEPAGTCWVILTRWAGSFETQQPDQATRRLQRVRQGGSEVGGAALRSLISGGKTRKGDYDGALIKAQALVRPKAPETKRRP